MQGHLQENEQVSQRNITIVCKYEGHIRESETNYTYNMMLITHCK